MQQIVWRFGLSIAVCSLILNRLTMTNYLDNAGKKFFIMFLENKADGDERRTSMQLLLTPCNKAQTRTSTYEIKSPRYRGIRTVHGMSGTIRAGTTAKVTVDSVYRVKGTAITDKVIVVKAARGDLVVYGVNRAYMSTGAFMALPGNVLDMNYIAACYFPMTLNCQIGIVATGDNTGITIVLSKQSNVKVDFAGRTYNAGSTISITLGKNQGFQMQAPGDLTGTQIAATKPVAVFSGNVRTAVNSTASTHDHIVEQLPPVSSWGKNYILAAFPGYKNGDLVRIIAGTADTSYTVYGKNKQLGVLKTAGDFVEVELSSNLNLKVVGQKPLLVIHISHSQELGGLMGDASMAFVPSVEQYSNSYTFLTPETGSQNDFENFVMVAIEEARRDELKIDGSSYVPPLGWLVVENSEPKMATSTLEISRGSHTMSHFNPAVRFGCILYGAAQQESYAMPLGLRFDRINKYVCKKTADLRADDDQDNDCDGKVDEEVCPDDVDDDGDGKVDEDCGISALEKDKYNESYPIDADVSFDKGYKSWAIGASIVVIMLLTCFGVYRVKKHFDSDDDSDDEDSSDDDKDEDSSEEDSTDEGSSDVDKKKGEAKMKKLQKQKAEKEAQMAKEKARKEETKRQDAILKKDLARQVAEEAEAVKTELGDKGKIKATIEKGKGEEVTQDIAIGQVQYPDDWQ